MAKAVDHRRITTAISLSSSFPSGWEESAHAQADLVSDFHASAFLVVVEAPIIDLARWLSYMAPAEAVIGWTAATQVFLRSHRKARRQVTFVDRACIEAPTDEETAHLTDRLWGAEAVHEAAALTLPDSPGTFYMLCAAAIIDADKNLAAIAGELRAATVGSLRGIEMGQLASDAWQSWRQAQTLAAEKSAALLAAKDQVKGANARAESLAAQVAAVQSAREHANERILALEAELADVRLPAAQRSLSIDDASARLDAVTTERDLMRKTLTLQSEALRDCSLRLDDCELTRSQLKMAQNETSHLRTALAATVGHEEKLKASQELVLTLQQELHRANGEAVETRSREVTLQDTLIESWYVGNFDGVIKGYGEDRAWWQAAHAGTQRPSRAAHSYKRAKDHYPPGLDMLDDWTARVQVGEAGERSGEELVSRRTAGHVFFGPYVSLSPGCYAADVVLSLKSGIRSQGYVLEVVACGDVVMVSSFSLVRGENRFLIPFYLPVVRSNADCEIRLYSPGKAEITLIRLQVLKAPTRGWAE